LKSLEAAKDDTKLIDEIKAQMLSIENVVRKEVDKIVSNDKQNRQDEIVGYMNAIYT
jgi:hypothetical protein